MKNRYLIIAALTALSCSSAAFAELTPLASLGLYNTGVTADGSALSGAGLVDAHYLLTVVPGGSNITQVGTALSGAPASWVEGTNSQWVGPANGTGDLNGPAGQYTYSTTFDLTGYYAQSFSLSGRWSTDNAGIDILLNGVSTGNSIDFGNSTNGYSFESFQAFSLTSGFVDGVNTLDFVVNNFPSDSESNPTGVNVEFTAADATATPEPGTFVLLGGAVLALGVARRKASSK